MRHRATAVGGRRTCAIDTGMSRTTRPAPRSACPSRCQRRGRSSGRRASQPAAISWPSSTCRCQWWTASRRQPKHLQSHRPVGGSFCVRSPNVGSVAARSGRWVSLQGRQRQSARPGCSRSAWLWPPSVDLTHTAAVAVADFLAGVSEGQVPTQTGCSLINPPPASTRWQRRSGANRGFLAQRRERLCGSIPASWRRQRRPRSLGCACAR